VLKLLTRRGKINREKIFKSTCGVFVFNTENSEEIQREKYKRNPHEPPLGTCLPNGRFHMTKETSLYDCRDALKMNI
jgi:hypothetical protein